MRKFIGWLIAAAVVYFGYRAGYFSGIINYFENISERSKEVQTIENDDGSITTVRYRSVVDLFTGK